MTVAAPETSSHVTIFAADWCPFCRKLRERLDRTETPYDLVDVDADGMDEVNAVSYTHLTLPTKRIV